MEPIDLRPLSRDVTRAPAGARMILLSLGAALIWQLFPWTGAGLMLRPDMVLLVLLFWTIHQPDSTGQGTAFAAGLVMDVVGSALLGQHALSFTVAVFLAQLLRVRILKFSGIEQTLHVLAILFVARTVEVLLNLLIGKTFPGFAIFASPIVTALLWVPLAWLLLHPSARRKPAALR